jgi:hypothetical protein
MLRVNTLENRNSADDQAVAANSENRPEFGNHSLILIARPHFPISLVSPRKAFLIAVEMSVRFEGVLFYRHSGKQSSCFIIK